MDEAYIIFEQKKVKIGKLSGILDLLWEHGYYHSWVDADKVRDYLQGELGEGQGSWFKIVKLDRKD